MRIEKVTCGQIVVHARLNENDENNQNNDERCGAVMLLAESPLLSYTAKFVSYDFVFGKGALTWPKLLTLLNYTFT